MITAIQAVPSGYAVSSPLPSGQVTQPAQKAKSLLSVPGVIVTLGATSPLPLTYNAAGLFTSLLTSLSAPGSTTIPVDAANTAGTVTDLAALLGLGATATSSGVPNASDGLQNLPATTSQALTGLLTSDLIPSSAGSADTLAINQALARQLAIDLNSSATGLGATTSAASTFSATGILQGLPPDLRVQALNSLLSTDLGLAAAAPLGSIGTAATTTNTGSVSTGITTAATTATPPNADIALALNSLLLANANLTTTSTGAVSSGITGTTTNTGTVSSAIPAVAAAPAAAIPAGTIAATPATATVVAASNATTTAAAGNASNTPEAASTLAGNFLLNSDAQAMANIAWNPAYANSVAELYVNMAISSSKQASAAALPNTTDIVQPVPAVPPVNAVPRYTG